MNKFKRIASTGLTHAALAVVGAVIATALVVLVFFPPRVEGVAPPASVEQRSVDGVCSLVVTGYGGEVWAAPLGESQLRRVDRAQLGLTGCRVDPSR